MRNKKNKLSSFNIKKLLLKVFQLFIVFIVYLFVLIFIGNLFIYLFPKEEVIQGLPNRSITTTTNFFLIGVILLLSAIKEEFKYRLFLNTQWKFILLSGTIFFIDSIFLLKNVKLDKSSSGSIIYILNVFWISGLMAFILNILFDPFKSRILAFFKSYLNFFVLLQIIFFALSHVIFSGQTENYHPFTVFGIHLIGASFYTYVRLKFGIIESIIFHLSYNLLLELIVIH